MKQGKPTLLLDIDGVLETTPSWRKPVMVDDGFPSFNPTASIALFAFLERTGSDVVLTSSHRINHTVEEWLGIFERRGIIIKNGFSKVDDTKSVAGMNRAAEIYKWAKTNRRKRFVIFDDDSSLNKLPGWVKSKWVKVNSATGLSAANIRQAIDILNNKY